MKKLGIIVLVLITVGMVFVGCATSIPVQVQRPAELELNGAQSIAVVPIRTSFTENLANANQNATVIIYMNPPDTSKPEHKAENACADYITKSLNNKLSNSKYLTLVGAVAVEKALNNGQPAPCDVYLTGKISDFKAIVLTGERSVRKGDVKLLVPEYKGQVSFTITYEIINASTNTIISSKTDNLTATSDAVLTVKELPSELQLMQYQIDSFTDKVMRQLQPYTITRNITLLSDKTKDPAMEDANKYAKGGAVNRAKEMFFDCYTNSNYFEAGYNAAMLMQVTGNLHEAKELMQKLVSEFGDVRATKALNDINNEIALAGKLQAQNAS